MNKTIGALRQLFLFLYTEQERDWNPQRQGRKPSARAQKLRNHLVVPLPPVRETDLEKWFPSRPSSDELRVDFSQEGRVLYLPPLQKNAEFVPILCTKCNVKGNKAEVNLQVMMVRLSDDGRTLQGIGFRLETPSQEEQKETQVKDSIHGFYHAQLIRGFGCGLSVECPDWLPEDQPSFPLAANSPTTLVLCLLLTLYGKKAYLDLFRSVSPLGKLLKEDVEGIKRCIGWTSVT
jgi:hypothetical protein